MINGGAGNDGIEYDLAEFSNGGENDSLAGIEDVYGTSGADTITGSNAGNVIYAGNGNDTIKGGGGNDNLQGAGDNDIIDAVDQTVDLVDCGGRGGTDTAKVDNIDAVRDCTNAAVAVTNVPATVPPTTPAPVVIRDPADKTKAKITALKAAKKAKAKTFRKTGRYSVTITSDEVVAGAFELESKAGKKALRKQLKKRKKLRLTIRLTDGGGNITTKTVTIKLT